MSNRASPNPFHVLGLPTTATETEVVQRGQELCALADSDEEVLRVRSAMEQLTTEPLTRRRHELLEVPGADYRQEKRERFAQLYRKAPVTAETLTDGSPPLRAKDFDLAAVLTLLLDDLLAPSAVDVRPAIEHSPVAPAPGAPPLETTDVIFG